MAHTYLDDIVSWHRSRARADRRDWRSRLDEPPYQGPSFLGSLRRPSVQVIAEVKRRSPSKGDLNVDLDPVALARAYRDGGAAAISVLTDERHFDGSADDLRAVRAVVEAPILRKDFTVCEHDVLDARDMGAAAVLLIVSVLDDDQLRSYSELATRCGLDALVEVHDEEELDRALDVGAALVGVNQRDLYTFDVDPRRAARVGARIPGSVVAVAESGLRTVADVERVADGGFDAVLVGEALVRSANPGDLVALLSAVARVTRA